MFRRFVVPVTAIVLLFAACVPLDRSPSSEPDYYRLSYEAKDVPCETVFSDGIVIRQFTADRPFEQERMVFWGRNRTVQFSESSRWVAEPGVMLGEAVLRDLSRSGFFPFASEISDPDGASLQLSGRVLRFAAEPCDAGYRARLGVAVRLQERGSGEDPLFQKRYSLQSDCFPAGEAARFAGAMSGLAAELSARLRGDLCRVAREREASSR